MFSSPLLSPVSPPHGDSLPNAKKSALRARQLFHRVRGISTDNQDLCIPLFDHSGQTHRNHDTPLSVPAGNGFYIPKPPRRCHAQEEIDIILGPNWARDEASRNSSNFGNLDCRSGVPLRETDIACVPRYPGSHRLGTPIYGAPFERNHHPRTAAQIPIWLLQDFWTAI